MAGNGLGCGGEGETTSGVDRRKGVTWTGGVLCRGPETEAAGPEEPGPEEPGLSRTEAELCSLRLVSTRMEQNGFFIVERRGR